MSLSPDDTYGLLAAPRRRYVLAELLENEYGTAEELAARIAAWEEGTAIDGASEGLRREVHIALVHNHLPRLADHGVVEYDARNGDVVRSDRFEDLRPAIEAAASRPEHGSTATVR